MATFNPAGSGGAPTSINIIGSSTINVQNVTLTLSNTEYIIVLPANCSKYAIQIRGASLAKFSFSPGTSGTTYWSLRRGVVHYVDQVTINGVIYVQSPTAGAVLEVLTYY